MNLAEPARLALRVDGLTKRFGFRTIFNELSFTLAMGDVLAVTGRNGAGKSTLLKILANVAEHSAGSIEWSIQSKPIDDDHLQSHIGFVAPYLQLYTEFTAWEHVKILQKMRGLPFDTDRTRSLFERFAIESRQHDRLETFSSGMLQRVKYICALAHAPTFLLLDEPMSNFDTEGTAAVREIVAAGSASRITLIATNEADDINLCSKLLSVGTSHHTA